MYTQIDGGFWFEMNFLVLYFTSIGEANMNATCNLRFLHCITDEGAIHKFDRCTFILECLVRTKKSWIRHSHYTGPVIVLLIVYASSLKTRTGNKNIGGPLVNHWTVDMLNKLEEERFSTNNVEEVKKSVGAKLKKASELIAEAEYVLDEALEENPHDTELIQLRELRDALFGARTFSQPTKDSPKANGDQNNEQEFPQEDAKNKCDFKQMDEEFHYTQVYGTPSAYVAYSEQVELEWSNKQKGLRSDNVDVSKFDLSSTHLDDTTEGGTANISHLEGYNTPEIVQGVSSVAHVSGNAASIGTKSVTPFSIYDAKPLQSIPHKAVLRRTKRNIRPAEVLRSPYVVREVFVCGAVSNHEKRAADCLFSGRFNETDILFKTDNVNGPRGVLETLYPSIMISSGVIDIFTKILNHAELYGDPMNQIHRVFLDTSLMHEWDVQHASAKRLDVVQAANKFNENMVRILSTTAYGNLQNVDLVFFPIIQGSHFFIVCMHLKWKEVHILDNVSSLVTDVSERYGDSVHYLVQSFPNLIIV